jgi:hypothetical protein
MSDQYGSGSDPEHGGPPSVPPMFPGSYGGGGGYGGPPGVQVPRQGQPPPYSGQQPQYPPAYGSPDPNVYLGAPGYPGYPGGPDPQGSRGYSGLAIAAFVTGLVLPLVGILAAIPLGIVALVKISKTHAKGRWMAIAGMTLSVLWWAAIIGVAIWAISNQAQRNDAGQIDKAGDLSFSDVRVGDCVTIDGLASGATIENLKGVPCADSHNAQAYWIVPINASDYPGEAAVAQQARRGCLPKFTPYAGLGLLPHYLYPTESVWNSSGGHQAVCFAIASDRGETTGSVVPAK